MKRREWGFTLGRCAGTMVSGFNYQGAKPSGIKGLASRFDWLTGWLLD